MKSSQPTGGSGDSTERHKGIYILPNLFTTAGLFAGFYAIIHATRGEYDVAAVAIFVAMIMDGLDGRIARWTGTTSEFGKEYDSLADLIAFGLAPGLVMYEWTLVAVGKIGWMAAFLYVAATALRLARFNTVTGADKAWFQGLPCPAAAVTMAAGIWLFHHLGAGDADVGAFAAVVTVALALAMISSIPWRSFKDIDLKGRISFPAAFAFAIVFAIVFWEPPIVLCMITTLYALSGPVAWIWRRVRGSELDSTTTKGEASVPTSPEVPVDKLHEDSSPKRSDNLH